MGVEFLVFVLLLSILTIVKCGYPPTGDEVQAGSVLLPATRRGRYLANIVRRQAVDGTGIKFNKDADRMNAEAKKKVDVLSEELLPYIIAEQERRTTLHKRVMTAIQNGEKGVTIAELRNKPPLIIRKGLMYRCPANRAPKEPDGSGVLMCEDDIVPTQVMYDSCLSAEDKELYLAENKFFFCNRHKIEGPDLPRNGSTVIGCAPIERTSLNYTTSKCTLEDTDDIVVHYRYYPDRTYKYVTELDPDHEVCDHWNPCQIGYIYSLPSPDQATPASELWQDSLEEAVHPSADNYTTSPRKVYYAHPPADNTTSGRRSEQQPSFTFIGVRYKRSAGPIRQLNERHVTTRNSTDNNSIIIILKFRRWKPAFYATYFIVFKDEKTGKERQKRFLVLVSAAASVVPVSLQLVNGQRVNDTLIPYKCNRCRLKGILVRSSDDNVYNVETSRYRIKEEYTTGGRQSKLQQFIEMSLEGLRPQDFGDYFCIIQNGDGVEERVKILSVQSPDTENAIKIKRLSESFDVGGHYDRTLNFTCEDCELSDILCNGESVLAAGRISIIPVSKMISFNFPRFEDSNSCVYMGFFRSHDKVFKKVLGVIDSSTTGVSISKVETVEAPELGQLFEHEVTFTCDDCTVEKVYVNGLQLDNYSYRRSNSLPNAVYMSSSTSINIHITEYQDTYEGIYQAIFNIRGDTVTKTILEIKDPKDKESAGETDGGGEGGEGASSTPAGEVSEGTGETTVAGEADHTKEDGGDKPEDAEKKTEEDSKPEETRRKS